MNTAEYLQILLKDIHSAAFATVDDNGLPQIRIIDIVLADENSLYFMTPRGTDFYKQLMAQEYTALSGTTGEGETLAKRSISIRGKVRNLGNAMLERIFQANPYMNNIYPANARQILEVFQLYEGQGEYFDFTADPVFRERFVIGKGEQLPVLGYIIDPTCIGCGLCFTSCPSKAIEISVPYRVKQEKCIRCGLCAEVCPVQCIHRIAI